MNKGENIMENRFNRSNLNPESIKNNLINDIRQKGDVNSIINQYKLFLKSVLERDIPDVDAETRNRIVNYAEDFLKKLVEKNYLSQDNKY